VVKFHGILGVDDHRLDGFKCQEHVTPGFRLDSDSLLIHLQGKALLQGDEFFGIAGLQEYPSVRRERKRRALRQGDILSFPSMPGGNVIEVMGALGCMQLVIGVQ